MIIKLKCEYSEEKEENVYARKGYIDFLDKCIAYRKF